MRKITGIIAALSIALGIGVAASPAYAKPSCGSGYICIYDDLSGTSLMAKKYWTDWAASVCYGMSVYDNRVSYVVNDSSHDILVALNDSCSRTTSVLYANSYGPMNSTWNNSISSWARLN